MNMNNVETRCVLLSGVVQGVGMRYFIRRTADRMDLSGYVKNLPDGTVECVCQGPKKDVKSFLRYVHANSPGTIRDMKNIECPADETYDGFRVRL